MNTSRKLSQKDIASMYEYLLFYEKVATLNYGKFNWSWIKGHKYIINNNIQIKCESKNQRPNFFRFQTYQINGTNDYAYHFLRHIRNAFAHGNIMKCNKNTLCIEDYTRKKDGTLKSTMKAKIEAHHFWQIMNIVKESMIINS